MVPLKKMPAGAHGCTQPHVCKVKYHLKGSTCVKNKNKKRSRTVKSGEMGRTFLNNASPNKTNLKNAKARGGELLNTEKMNRTVWYEKAHQLFSEPFKLPSTKLDEVQVLDVDPNLDEGYLLAVYLLGDDGESFRMEWGHFWLEEEPKKFIIEGDKKSCIVHITMVNETGQYHSYGKEPAFVELESEGNLYWYENGKEHNFFGPSELNHLNGALWAVEGEAIPSSYEDLCAHVTGYTPIVVEEIYETYSKELKTRRGSTPYVELLKKIKGFSPKKIPTEELVEIYHSSKVNENRAVKKLVTANLLLRYDVPEETLYTICLNPSKILSNVALAHPKSRSEWGIASKVLKMKNN